MATITLTVEGWKEAVKKLKQLEPQVGKKIFRKELRKQAKVVQAALKQSAPVATPGSEGDWWSVFNDTLDPGTTRDNINIRAMKRSRKAGIGMEIGLFNDAKGWPQDVYFYPPHVELGTRYRDAHPWMRPTFNRIAQGLANSIAAGIVAGINQAVAALATK